MSALQLFDPLDTATEAALRASIEKYGVLVPVIMTSDDTIIDGHHRKRIAAELGIECPFEICEENDLADVAFDLNAARRQLTPEDRQKAVVHLRSQGRSLRAIGDSLGVSEGTVRNDLKQAESTAKDYAVPDRIVGRDGRSQPATRPMPEPKPQPSGRIIEDDTDDFDDDVIDIRPDPTADTSRAKAHAEAMSQLDERMEATDPEYSAIKYRANFAKDIVKAGAIFPNKPERVAEIADDELIVSLSHLRENWDTWFAAFDAALESNTATVTQLKAVR